jgi:hypothetical protein
MLQSTEAIKLYVIFLQEAKLSIHTVYLLFFIQFKVNGFFVDKKYFDQTETEGLSK